MKLHSEAVSPKIKKAAETLKAVGTVKDFYLAGGTALTLYLGHRMSVAVDLFSATNPVGFNEREDIKQAIKTTSTLKVIDEKDGNLNLLVDETEVSFLKYSYPLVGAFVSWKGLSIASLEDVALMKMGALIGRGARKDFVDMHAICQRLKLGKLFELAKRKFPDVRDFAFQAAKALVYFDDAEREKMPMLLKRVNWEEIKSYFEEEVPKIIKKSL